MCSSALTLPLSALDDADPFPRVVVVVGRAVWVEELAAADPESEGVT